MPNTPEGSQPVEMDAIVKALRLAAKPFETPTETRSRLAREEADAKHQRQKELILLRSILAIVGVVSVVCIGVVLVPGSPPENTENTRWGTTLLTSIVSAGLGYMTGKSSK